MSQNCKTQVITYEFNNFDPWEDKNWSKSVVIIQICSGLQIYNFICTFNKLAIVIHATRIRFVINSVYRCAIF